MYMHAHTYITMFINYMCTRLTVCNMGHSLSSLFVAVSSGRCRLEVRRVWHLSPQHLV